MNIFYAATSTLFFVWILRNILYWVHLWQIKEYRWDRLVVHLKETVQGRSLFLSPLLLLKVILMGAFIVVIQKQFSLSLYHSVIAFVFALQFRSVVKEIGRKTIKIPKPTIKAVAISGFSFFILFSLFSLPLLDRFAWILLVDRLLPIVVLITTRIMSFPSGLYYDWKINRAIRLLRRQKKLIVIGITGSYGKSSTKEYLAQLLGKKFSVLSTPGTQNTPIGLAKTILAGLKTTHIFIAEMGAYKKGEIAQLAQMVHPAMCVITGINAQHLSLFGSIANTMDAKYELVQSLPFNGFCLFNANSPYAYQLWVRAKEEKRNALLYKATKEPIELLRRSFYDYAAVAYHIRLFSRSVTFDALIKKGDKTIKLYNLQIPIGGIHVIENALPALFIGCYLGMKAPQMQEGLSLLVGSSLTMGAFRNSRGTVFMDDTYNTNPDGVRGAMSVLSEYKKRKKGKVVCVMQPMIELGDRAKEEHQLAGRMIGSVCSHLFLTNRNFYRDMIRGAKQANRACIAQIKTPGDIAQFVAKLGKNDVVLFEGREAVVSLKHSLAIDNKRI